MSPWFEGKLRLADRQGLLTGRGISRVQSLALQILMVMDAKVSSETRSRQLLDALKMALVAQSPMPERATANLFPELFGEEEKKKEQQPEPEPQDEEELIELLGDRGPATWVFKEEMTEEEAMATIAQLMANNAVDLTADDVEKGWM